MNSRLVDVKSLTVEDVLAEISAAQTELSALCNGKRFRMCIPVADDDSDIVIGAALAHAHELLAGRHP